MEINLLVAFLLILNSIRLCYQQDITVCSIGFDYINGSCVQRSCPESQILVNGLCQPKPQEQQCAIGFTFINGICVQQQICPNGYDLVNGTCQPKATYSDPIPPHIYCAYGYTLHNGLCYQTMPITPAPCQPKSCGIFNCASTCTPVQTTMPPAIILPTPTTTTTTTTPATIIVVPTLPPAEIKRGCPPESVLIDGECRLVYCPKGTNYKGRCLEPVCSHGLVWTGHSCAKPEVITTILEIENKFITEPINQTGPVSQVPDIVNNVIYHTESYETSTTKSCSATSTSTSTSTSPPPPGESTKCCTIITPRMCKRFNSKWVCFNRQYRRCDHVCNNHTMIYLRVPKVIEQASYLVVPPNPPLQVCANEACSNKDLVDCSGCAKNQREGCSAYCYRYRCPKERCTFIDQSEYCTDYPGSSGCSSYDGCVQEWCTNDNNHSVTKCH